MLLSDCFDSFIDYKRKQGHTEHTILEYKFWMKEVLMHCVTNEKQLEDLRLTDVADIQFAARNHGAFGPQRSVSLFRQLLRYLDEDGQKIPFNWFLIKLPHVAEKEQDFMEEQEFERFVNQLDTNKFFEIRDRALYETLWSTGLRIGEALALDRSDFAKGEKVIKNEKGGSEAKVFFSDRCIYWLNEYMKRRADNCEALFVTFTNEGAKRVLRCRARQRLHDYCKRFKCELKVTHMIFRRSFGSKIINTGADIKQAQYLMRHRSERTILKFYAKVKQQKLRGIHNQIFNKGIVMPVVVDPQKVPCG